MTAITTTSNQTFAWVNRAWGTVETVQQSRYGLYRLRCRLESGIVADAIAYACFTGEVTTGDRVLLNTTGVDLGLGTGGAHFVIASGSDVGRRTLGAGHIVKLRYTPLQTAVLTMEEQCSPHHDVLEDADSLNGMPVICCQLVSQAPAVVAGLQSTNRQPRVAVVVTDEAALPIGYCDLLMDLGSAGHVASIITTGQAFGGDLEAVNLHSGLLGARHVVKADVALVTPGPGTVGTGTRWGFSAVRQGEAINAAHTLSGKAIGVVRASGADRRDRHRGISHHTKTVFTRMALAPFWAAWPSERVGENRREWESLILESNGRLEGVTISGAAEALNRFEALWRAWSTMGRTRDEDPLYYEAAAAAGILAARLWEERKP